MQINFKKRDAPCIEYDCNSEKILSALKCLVICQNNFASIVAIFSKKMKVNGSEPKKCIQLWEKLANLRLYCAKQ